MPDQHAAFQNARIVHLHRSPLPKHLTDSRCGNLRVVCRCTVGFGKICIHILHIRHVYLHQPLQHLQRLHTLIAGAVPYHRDAQIKPGQHLGKESGMMGGCHKVDVVHARVPKAQKERAHFLHAELFAHSLPADLVILTEDALQAAAGEENRPRAPCACDAGLLAEMGGCTDHRRQGKTAAESSIFRLRADYSTLSRAVIALISKFQSVSSLRCWQIIQYAALICSLL